MSEADIATGFPFSFGVTQIYYSSHEPFMGPGNIAIIATCTSGIMYLSGLPALVLNRMYPRVGRWLPMIGLPIMCLALALSSFATTVTLLLEHLLNTYGHETTLRVWACSLFVVTAPLAYFIKPRLPPSPVTHLRAFNLRFALSAPFVF